MAEEELFNLKVAQSGLELIIKGVKKLPYEIADPILQAITHQVKEQLDARKVIADEFEETVDPAPVADDNQFPIIRQIIYI